MRKQTTLLLAVLACLATSCGGSGDDITLQGAGATFPAPLYKRWFLEYYRLHPNVRVNYQAIGSGAGVRKLTEGLTHLAASDTGMSDKEIAEAKKSRPEQSDVLLVPMAAGSIALCYNLPTLSPDQPLRLRRETLLQIIRGDITDWRSPELVRDNPDLANVPETDANIIWVRRSDSSGTTYAFTNHLSAISPAWKEKYKGAQKSLTWPVGIGGRGNEGVAALVKQTSGAIGYLEYGYATLSGLSMAAYENNQGEFVRPSPESSKKALAGAKLPDNFRLFVPDPKGKGAYSIVTYTWICVLKDYRPVSAAGDRNTDESDPHYQRAAKTARAVKEVLTWCLTTGQEKWVDRDGQKLEPIPEQLGYVSLPPDARQRVLDAIAQIKP